MPTSSREDFVNGLLREETKMPLDVRSQKGEPRDDQKAQAIRRRGQDELSANAS